MFQNSLQFSLSYATFLLQFCYVTVSNDIVTKWRFIWIIHRKLTLKNNLIMLSSNKNLVKKIDCKTILLFDKYLSVFIQPSWSYIVTRMRWRSKWVVRMHLHLKELNKKTSLWTKKLNYVIKWLKLEFGSTPT